MIDEFTKYLARLEEQWVEEKPIRLELRDGKIKNCFDVCISKHHVLSRYIILHSGASMPFSCCRNVNDQSDLRND